MRHLYLSAVMLLVLPAAARAGLVNPGSTATVNALDTVPPGGSLLDQATSAFAIDYGAPSTGFDGKLHGSFTSSVYQLAGKLTFVYGVQLDPSNPLGSAAEASKLMIGAFGNASTSLSGTLGNEINLGVGRSNDGQAVWLQSQTPGAGGAPMLIVSTNAINYNQNGMATFFAGDELPGSDGMSKTFYGQASFAAFAPIRDPSPPSAIPLPPAFFTGLGVLVALAILATTKRFWYRSVVG